MTTTGRDAGTGTGEEKDARTSEKTPPESRRADALLITLAFAAAAWTACEARQERSPDEHLAASIGSALTAACPIGDDPSDEVARDACADKLTELAPLRNAMIEPFIWGTQSEGYNLEEGTNKFNPRVWRRLYLSTFMFGQGSVERVEDGASSVVLHMPVSFRHAMPTGAYPYPFWHTQKKWDSYSYSTTLHFVIRDGKLVGALRSAQQETTRPKTPHAWDGAWRWEQDGRGMPYVSLYDYLLSKDNPHAAELDDAYRALEAEMRKHGCPTCHAPDNKGGSRQLEFFVYPNQALAGRHDIITQLIDDQMPPENDLGIDSGIADAGDRARLLYLARDFERTGDAALAWEGEAP